ncbi:MAG: NADH-ubiquinone oxidoreductase [Firmicutes bacterium]|nr:NADH-ubiquinone oxidoreductase [Bacillota bacterium]
MSAATWLGFWLAFLILGWTGWGRLSISRRQASWWLTIWELGGAASLALQGAGVAGASVPHLVHLPRPWPQLMMHPLLLGSLDAEIAAILFAAAAAALFRHPQHRRIFFAMVPLEAGVGVFLLSGDGLTLLMAWEFLSAVSYLGLVTWRRSRSVWNAGWVLLALSELAGLALLVAVGWLSLPLPVGTSESFATWALLPHSQGLVTAMMVLILVAFGVKAGLFPLMIWMPLAEPVAPGPIAGLFSGLMPVLSVTAILTLDAALHPGLWWGLILIVLGALGALTGGLYAIVSRHAKRVLAYSTLEIMGLVFAALGTWKVEMLRMPGNVGSQLALDGAIILLVVHAGAKFTLFVATDFSGRWAELLDRLGGLQRLAPGLGAWALAAVALLAGLPPLGGFVGEWLILESILKSFGNVSGGGWHLALGLEGAVLALAMALGVTAYLRWYGFIFLGPSRQPLAPARAAPSQGLTLSMGLATTMAGLVGPAIPWVLPWLNRALRPVAPQATIDILAPSFSHPHSVAALVKIGVNLLPAPGAPGTVFFPQGFSVADPTVLTAVVVLALGVLALVRRWRSLPARSVAPWNGGYVRFNPKTAFSAEGFVHPLRLAWARFYGLRRERGQTTRGAHFYRHTIVYRVEEHLYLPLMRGATWTARLIRTIQSGQTSHYVAWVSLAVLAALAAAVAWPG